MRVIFLRYECALIRNWQHKTPVLPVFVAERIGNTTFTPCNFRVGFLDVPHKRSDAVQAVIDTLRYELH